MTYSVNGKQYIALVLGGRPGRDEGLVPGSGGDGAERDPDGVRTVI